MRLEYVLIRIVDVILMQIVQVVPPFVTVYKYVWVAVRMLNAPHLKFVILLIVLLVELMQNVLIIHQYAQVILVLHVFQIQNVFLKCVMPQNVFNVKQMLNVQEVHQFVESQQIHVSNA